MIPRLFCNEYGHQGSQVVQLLVMVREIKLLKVPAIQEVVGSGVFLSASS
jgi:hypothetical protein